MSQKIKDDKNRWRNKTVGFRVSPEEWEVFNDKVRLCGYSKKQDYIMDCLMHHKVTAKGNPLMLTQFRADLKKILMELQSINNQNEMDEELLSSLTSMLDILEAFKENEGKKG